MHGVPKWGFEPGGKKKKVAIKAVGRATLGTRCAGHDNSAECGDEYVWESQKRLTSAAKSTDSRARRPVDEALGVLANNAGLVRDRLGLAAAFFQVLVVILDDLGRDVLPYHAVLLARSLRCGRSRGERHGRAASVGNQIRRRRDARRTARAGLEEAVVTNLRSRVGRDIVSVLAGSCRKVAVAPVSGGHAGALVDLGVLGQGQALDGGLALFGDVPDDVGDRVRLVLEVAIGHINEARGRHPLVGQGGVLEVRLGLG